MASANILPQVRFAPPPVKSADCATAYEVGTELLIDTSFNGTSRVKQATVTVEKVTVSHYAISEGRTITTVLYGLRCRDAHDCFGNSYRVMGEAELQKRFIAFVW